jgi:hypothetical protein
MISSCVPNPYTTVCTTTIYQMISGLESLNLPVYQDFIKDSCCNDLNYFAVFPIQFGVSNYILYQTDLNDNINFWSINMSLTNVLTANYFTFNVIPAVIVNYRTLIVLKYKNKSFKLLFSVPFLDQLTGTKSVIQNLFNDSTKAFVLYDKIVLFFSKINDDKYYRFVYAGILSHSLYSENKNDLFVLPTTKFDFANGTLVGLLDKKPYLLYNKFGIQSVNLYPYANYVFNASDQKNNKVVVGGINNYFLQPEIETKPNLWKCSYCFELQYQAPFFKTDNNWGYVPLEIQILIPNTCDYIEPATGPTYIMAFDSKDPQYVYLGNTQFLNSDNTIITFKKSIIYTENAELVSWYVYPPTELPIITPDDNSSNLYYYYNGNDFIIYKPTFNNFISLNTAAISIADLQFSTSRNEHLIQVRPPTYGSTYRTSGDGYDPQYKQTNWYFLYFSISDDGELYLSDQSYDNNYNDDNCLKYTTTKTTKKTYKKFVRNQHTEKEKTLHDFETKMGKGSIQKIRYDYDP